MPHRRYNPLLDEWVLVSPHRTQRPWLGAEESTSDDRPSYDPDCYLCPGNKRAGGVENPSYHSTYVFQNDFAALMEPSESGDSAGIMRSEPAGGECRVLCFSPDHDLTLAKMSLSEIDSVIQMWIEQTVDLGRHYQLVQIFENHGSAMGASNPHPHGQVWATDYLPTIPAREQVAQSRYHTEHGRTLLGDYLFEELVARERVVVENDSWVLLVPFWATWPFETLLLPKRPISSLLAVTPEEVRELAKALKAGLQAYDRLFETDFPYSMGWHGLPRLEESPWHLHAHFCPPLLRSATVRKFMVGFEMLGESQRDLTPEQAAERLRALVG